jgi:anthranilate phosphoribosyltransferase
VRTGINSVARELNPAGAPAMLQGVFHPPYIPLHAGAQRILGQPRALTFKGGGGEGQRNPDKPCRSVALVAGVEQEIVWPRLGDGAPWPWRDEPLEPRRLAALWRGDWEAPAPVAAVVGTAAMALWLTGRAADPAAADGLAAELWARRDRLRPLPLAA